MEDNNDQQTAAEEVELIPLLPESKKSRKGVIAGVSVLAVLAAAVGFAAVRSSGPGVISLAKSAQLTERQHTARVEMTMKLPVPSLANKSLLATGLYDFDRKLTTVDMDMTEALGSKLPSTGNPDAGKVTMTMQGLVAYMKIGVFDMVSNLKGKWIKMDIGSMGGATGVDIAVRSHRRVLVNGSTDAILYAIMATCLPDCCNHPPGVACFSGRVERASRRGCARVSRTRSFWISSTSQPIPSS